MFLSAAALAAACGNSIGPSAFGDGQGGEGGSDGSLADSAPILEDDAALLGDGSVDLQGALSIAPVDALVDVTSGQPAPKLSYAASVTGQIVAAEWAIDRGEIASIDAATGVLTPKGTIGGKAIVTASYRGRSVSTSVTVKIHVVQNGGATAGDAGGGAGGNGGVGGEGPGVAVSDPTRQTLLGAGTSDPGLSWLYPYDKTVWPRGIPAPLLQWKAGAQLDYDAVYIHVTENAFEYQGFFNKTATPFAHHPIPQDVWKQLGYSNGGEEVTVSLVFAKGAVAYGPITEKWKIAQGTLKGTVYYNSYGTNLAKNYCCTSGNKSFGGATLAIKAGSTDPVLIAGNDGNDSNCRVCHSVSANGAVLITQHGNSYGTSGSYALTSANTETTMLPGDGRFAWPALTPDGTMLFSNSSPVAGGSSAPSALFAVPSGTPIATAGIPAGLGAGMPAFSPDGKHVVYNFHKGAGSDARSLASMDFDAATKAFSNAATVHTPSAGTSVWPSFMPTSDSFVFQLETASNGRDFAATRATSDTGAGANTGARGELWWADVKTKQSRRLDAANGVGNVPVGANQHDADATLNFEPTVNPVPSGGYAWVVFTSRRMYGNVATVNPYWSDPRFHDLSATPTPKKLWVAAIDLNAPAGTDPSHPAFYLPGQELLAGNSRGFWVVDPCHANATACETGDECCGGFCRAGEDGGALTCKPAAPGCAQEYEKCAVTADCCGNNQGILCINGRCATEGPK